MSGYEKTKFENLVRVYREGVGQMQEQNQTIKALHDRVEQLENENVELRRTGRERDARLDKAEPRIDTCAVKITKLETGK